MSRGPEEEIMPSTVQFHRVMRTTPERIFRAFVTPEAIVKWLPPNGFVARVHQMDAWKGGNFKMSFINFTTGSVQSFGGQYTDFVANELLRWTDRFDDPNLAGEMTNPVRLKNVGIGTEIHITQEGIPDPIPAEACVLGWQESLTVLALLVETEIPDQM
jgi:uncharacterized protein YndB with AHSA1/START domain